VSWRNEMARERKVLEQEFHAQMLEICKREREIGRDPKLFERKIRELGGVSAAKYYLKPRSGPTQGFGALRRRQRLDLTVESLVLEDRLASLFTADELATAKKRLSE
jgi:hypothetical protein